MTAAADLPLLGGGEGSVRDCQTTHTSLDTAHEEDTRCTCTPTHADTHRVLAVVADELTGQ